MRNAEFQADDNISVEYDVCLDPQKSFIKLFKRTVILLAGPTGSGKTTVSLWLAPMVDGEIISVDSMQVYRGMDIGTAKVSLEDRERVPHHLIDICHIQETFNVVDFYYHAMQACQSILTRNKVPILVGGSGFYFHTFLSGTPQGPPADHTLRRQLAQYAQDYGIECLYASLCEKDPEYASTITKNDKNKVIRALEIIHLTGKRVSDHHWNSQMSEPKEYYCRGWFLSPPQELLRDQIQYRCHRMLEENLLGEVEQLLHQGIRENTSASRAIGYREWIEFIDHGSQQGEYEDTKRRFIANTWQYTKKQKTWFKRYPLFRELPTRGLSAEAIAEKIAEDYFLHG
ncbi:tRNA (adenosine(37)-N6)-dimethylallyltransferase MiaA [Chlamydia gallinacea]|uniref:tRNA dimethylallyltransferase n=2 Tax=Chlamydia gallinacea TaxID=1457153 RepID=A0A173DYD6_9CHLA|nr:tRNA (adenosine(37)-N6)-dimethylallyltransferase MiaA [Chlamydia gallinacea]EYE60766.1 tRNA dimethylallyltransferase [Bacteroides fragilis str. S6L5]ANG65923.1 tRNA (adenosine(37)-N6)-dimethylallyltransferase MiaA [Chlamydia gallinacea 08-1274/3]AQT77840.1 tRNA dimethylallyltransferase [Chlamydia gallinacea]MBX6680574.1 tRNA (adenosine(37)-N6)-dimethylallyltransferase MiaA [Chlamydia gallinacea]MBX6687398.1 tRNA (adenosine(37)-N6)-dimethylallyltransferase MiaA [Chlamydia gallinacea]